MKPLLRKWWFWLIIIAIILIILFAPVICTTAYLPDQATQTAVPKTFCRSLINLGQVY